MGEKKNGNKKGGDGEKKEKAPVPTANLKLPCQCDGCIDKIHKTISRTKGVNAFDIDKQKDLVIVKGTMDVNALAKALKKKLERNFEILPPKTEKDGDVGGGENGSGGALKKKNKGSNGGGDGGNKGHAGGGRMVEDSGYTPGYPGYIPGYGYAGYGHPHLHPHGHWYGHAYPAYVPGYQVSAYPPHQMFN